MFNPDFYPTPKEVIDQMIGVIDLHGAYVLEPSAGKGNIVDELKRHGAEVSVCEKNPDLAAIVSKKANFLKSDFMQLKSDEVSHFEFIFMNPPFSADEHHILHAWEIAPGGCQIVALCNSNTIKNRYSRMRGEFGQIIEVYGSSVDLGDCFKNSERSTGVEISLIRLFKPKLGDNEFEDYFEEDEEDENHTHGILKYNQIREIVSRYTDAVKKFDEVSELSSRINETTSIFGDYRNIWFGAHWKSNNTHIQITRGVYKKELQKSAWKYVFSLFNMEKYITKSVKEEINKFVETQTNVPFTMKNIYLMIEGIVGGYEKNMNDALLELFDNITKHYHDNRYSVEGWKTNKHHMINKKLIFPRICGLGQWSGKLEIEWDSRNGQTMEDFCKALCYITGENFDTYCVTFRDWRNTEEREFGVWYDWNFFEIKCFKKGTMHLKFKDEELWAKVNRKMGELRGFPLPEKI